jgi:serine/threonine-protein phosphatase 6 regulatory ankyrin repeat subunit B
MIKHVVQKLKAKAGPNVEGWTPLHTAAKHDRAQTVEELVRMGFDLTAKDREGNMALHIACASSSHSSVERLLELKASIDAEDELGETPLFECARKGNLELLEMLIEKRANVMHHSKNNRNILHFAVGKGAGASVSQFQELLKFRELDVNQATTDMGETPLHMAVKANEDRIVRLLAGDPRLDVTIEDTRGEAAVVIAARNDQIQVLQELFAKVQGHGAILRRAFVEAVRSSSAQAAKYIFDAFSVQPADCQDSQLNNCLHLVAISDDEEIASWLLEIWGHSSPEALKAHNAEGKTPLEVAEIHDHQCIMRLFHVHSLLSQDPEEPLRESTVDERAGARGCFWGS